MFNPRFLVSMLRAAADDLEQSINQYGDAPTERTEAALSVLSNEPKTAALPTEAEKFAEKMSGGFCTPVQALNRIKKLKETFGTKEFTVEQILKGKVLRVKSRHEVWATMQRMESMQLIEPTGEGRDRFRIIPELEQAQIPQKEGVTNTFLLLFGCFQHNDFDLSAAAKELGMDEDYTYTELARLEKEVCAQRVNERGSRWRLIHANPRYGR